jgi:hypothetical protein
MQPELFYDQELSSLNLASVFVSYGEQVKPSGDRLVILRDEILGMFTPPPSCWLPIQKRTRIKQDSTFVAWEKRSRMNQRVVWDPRRPRNGARGLIDSDDINEEDNHEVEQLEYVGK